MGNIHEHDAVLYKRYTSVARDSISYVCPGDDSKDSGAFDYQIQQARVREWRS
jgi:hypothetical protein